MMRKDKKRFKVAMIGHKRVPSREGGIEVVVEELSVRMVERGLKVDVYNRKDRFGKAYKQPREYKGIRIIQIPTFKVSALNAFVYSVLASFRALFGGYDCIHYHAEGPCAMMWLPKLFGIHTVATIHGLDWQRAKWGGFSTKYLKLGEKCASKYADELIVLSNNNQKYFKETYGRDTHLIPNGIVKKNADYSAREISERFGLQKDGYILFLARIVPEKGLHYLIEAFKTVETNKKLVIAGDLTPGNEYVEKIKKMASEDERIILTGFVQGRLLDELFSNCYIYVLPSDIEGLAMSLLESVSYGVPCLVSDIPENVEVVGGYMPSCKHGDIQGLSVELDKILKGEYSDIWKKENFETILKKYDWEKIVDQTTALYKKGK